MLAIRLRKRIARFGRTYVRQVLLLQLVLVVTVVTTVGAQDVLKSIDVFGSDQVSAEDIRDNWGDELAVLANLLKSQDHLGFTEKRKELIEAAGQSGVYSFVDLAVFEQYLPEYGVHVTIDLVDPVDEESRLNYGQRPLGDPVDPDSLIAKWIAYDKAARLVRDRDGTISTSCNYFHCVWGYNDPALVEFGDYFKTHVRDNQAALRTILSIDKDHENREAAMFLLAHGNSQKEVLASARLAIGDAHPVVRAAGLEIMSSLSSKRPDLIDLDEVLGFLNAPTVRERAAAIQVVRQLSGPLTNRERILAEGGASLVSMMQLDQPANGLPSYELLKKASGRDDLSRFDETAWIELVEQVRLMTAASK